MFKMLVDIHEEFKQIDIKSTSTISGLTTFIKKCSPLNTKYITKRTQERSLIKKQYKIKLL